MSRKPHSIYHYYKYIGNLTDSPAQKVLTGQHRPIILHRVSNDHLAASFHFLLCTVNDHLAAPARFLRCVWVMRGCRARVSSCDDPHNRPGTKGMTTHTWTYSQTPAVVPRGERKRERGDGIMLLDCCTFVFSLGL